MRNAFLVSLSALAAVGHGCCAIGDRPTEFGGQSNIILYDRARGIEHFVRQAEFTSKSDSVGFIAPTPTMPKLAEVKPDLFLWLHTYMESQRPKGMSRSRPGGGSSGGAPTILAVQDVAGYEATILKATDAIGMTEWMSENEYTMNEDVANWIKFYVEKEWIFTAFKVKKSEDGQIRTGLVRMSFATPQPYNPYFVPASNIGSYGKGLSVMTIDSLETFEDAGFLTPGFQCAFPEHERATIAKLFALKTTDLPKGPLLMQKWHDGKFPRRDAPDIFFKTARELSLAWMR